MAKPVGKNPSLRPSLAEYERVFAQENHNSSTEQVRNHFEACKNLAAEQLKTHPFWTDLATSIQEWDAQYRAETGAESLYKGQFSEQAALHLKSWNSTFLKAYRKNVLNNADWPEKPAGGLVTVDNWFENVGDILRTQLVCRYIDGVKFLVGRLKTLAHKHNLQFKDELQATTEGYYAGHVDVFFSFCVTDMRFNSGNCLGKFEIQVTTQLKEVVKQLLHAHYEKDRLRTVEEKSTQWQWDYLQPSFDANYLGHVVHY